MLTEKMPDCCLWNAEMMKPISSSLQPSCESRRQKMLQWFPANQSPSTNTIDAFYPLHLAVTQRMSFLQGRPLWGKWEVWFPLPNTTALLKQSFTSSLLLITEINDPPARWAKDFETELFIILYLLLWFFNRRLITTHLSFEQQLWYTVCTVPTVVSSYKIIQ